MTEVLKMIQANAMQEQKYFDFNSPEYLHQQCDNYNNMQGHLNEIDGYNCDECKNKGHLWIVNDNEILQRYCHNCKPIRDSLKILRESGLVNCTFKNFVCSEEWQKKIIIRCKEFVKNTKGEWLFIGGQSGSGKTHLCTSALRELVFAYHVSVALFKWQETAKRLKQIVNDISYTSEIAVYKNAKVLYIDDFFKVKKGEKVTAADVNLAYELLDYRYCNNLLTIISSEFSLGEIIDIDEAVGGRIKQRAKNYVMYIDIDKSKNYRLK